MQPRQWIRIVTMAAALGFAGTSLAASDAMTSTPGKIPNSNGYITPNEARAVYSTDQSPGRRALVRK